MANGRMSNSELSDSIKNIDNFLTFLGLFTYEPDILIFTKTWLTKYDDPIIYFKNYNIYQTNRSFKNKKRWWCSYFCEKMYKTSIIDNLSISITDSIDIVSIQIIDEKSKKHNILSAIYRSSDSDTTVFNYLIFNLFSNYIIKYLFLFGDFNIDFSKN